MKGNWDRGGQMCAGLCNDVKRVSKQLWWAKRWLMAFILFQAAKSFPKRPNRQRLVQFNLCSFAHPADHTHCWRGWLYSEKCINHTLSIVSRLIMSCTLLGSATVLMHKGKQCTEALFTLNVVLVSGIFQPGNLDAFSSYCSVRVCVCVHICLHIPVYESYRIIVVWMLLQLSFSLSSQKHHFALQHHTDVTMQRCTLLPHTPLLLQRGPTRNEIPHWAN